MHAELGQAEATGAGLPTGAVGESGDGLEPHSDYGSAIDCEPSMTNTPSLRSLDVVETETPGVRGLYRESLVRPCLTFGATP